MTLSAVLAFCFFACSAVVWINVRQILRDRMVAGVSLFPTIIFIITNVVEVFYFWDLLDWWSTAGAVSMTLANVVWIALAYHYRRQLPTF